MKKHLLLLVISIVLISIPFNANAQDAAAGNDLNDFQKMDLFCSCINSLMNQLHPRTRVMVRDLSLIGPEAAQQKLTKYLEENPDDYEQIMQDGATMQNFESAVEKTEGCENLNSILNSTQNAEGAATEEELEAHLDSKVECEYAAIFFKLGKKDKEAKEQKN